MNKEHQELYYSKQPLKIVDAMQKIDINAKGFLFITDENMKLSGVITDGDIRRWLIKTGNLNCDVSELMNKNPKVILRKDINAAQDIMRKNSITALPVITTKGILKDIILKDEKEKDTFKEEGLLNEVPVIIMAGGKGTRLYPYTKILPKPLIPIGDIPIIERIMDKFCDEGTNRFFITVNYRKSMIKSYFSDTDNDFDIRYVEEDKPLGTAGSLSLIENKFSKPVIITNCDILINADYSEIYKYHENTGNALTIVTAVKNIVVPYGVIHSSEDGRVESMEEKPKLSYFVNTGMYVVNPEILDEIPKDTFFHMTDLADKLLKENKKVGMFPISEDSFLDMGEIEEMHRMEKKLNLKME